MNSMNSMNSIPNRSINPTPELMAKIRRVRVAIAEQQPREIRCPHCKRKIGVAFEDTRGHFETKCEKCGKIVLLDLVNTRKIRKVI
mgnify:FL=1